MRKSKVAVATFFVVLMVNMFSLPITVHAETYSANAVWIYDQPWIHYGPNANILSANLSKVVADLSGANIEYAIVFVGYWNASTNNINYFHTDAFYATVISALHAIDVKVIAWGEDGGGTMDITPTNRQNIYNSIVACMNKGFDGYSDDIEAYVGTRQQWIDYLNNCTAVLHGLGKLHMPAVPYDWQQNINQYLHVDYILSMFYGSRSTFEDAQATYFWQEDFGEYEGHDTPPASSIIIGIMNFYGSSISGTNTNPLSWQLAQCSNLLASYGHPQLAGFCIWVYEYMDVNAPDWSAWNNWIVTEIPESKPFLFLSLLVAGTMSAILIAEDIKKKRDFQETFPPARDFKSQRPHHQ